MERVHGKFVCVKQDCPKKRETVSLAEPGTVLGRKARRLTLKDLGAPVTTLPVVQEGRQSMDTLKYVSATTFAGPQDGRLKGHSNPKAEKVIRGTYHR